MQHCACTVFDWRRHKVNYLALICLGFNPTAFCVDKRFYGVFLCILSAIFPQVMACPWKDQA